MCVGVICYRFTCADGFYNCMNVQISKYVNVQMGLNFKSFAHLHIPASAH
jgi:hypothetical protein